MIINVWRPIRGPVQQWPLAVCDARSFPQEDLHPTWLRRFDVSSRGIESGVYRQTSDGTPEVFRTGEVLTPVPHPAHRWVVYPDMSSDEVLLLKTFDSRSDGRARLNVHTAFFDPNGPTDFERESIELRCLILLQGAARAKL